MKEEKKIYITTSLEFYLEIISTVLFILLGGILNFGAIILKLDMTFVIATNLAIIIFIMIILFSPLIPLLIKSSTYISEK